MTSTQIHIPSTWRVHGTVDDVYDILTSPTEFVRWWPSVYLQVEELEPGDADGVGRVLRLRTKGKLPYILEWVAKAVEIERPHRIVVEATGDLVGMGEWQLSQSGDCVEVRYSWTVNVTRVWMKLLLPLLRPVFVANHRWAMQKGEEGLKRELGNRPKRSEAHPMD